MSAFVMTPLYHRIALGSGNVGTLPELEERNWIRTLTQDVPAQIAQFYQQLAKW